MLLRRRTIYLPRPLTRDTTMSILAMRFFPFRMIPVKSIRNSSSAKGIWNRLCPVDKNGKREFEPTMYARLEKLGLGHKKHDPDLLTEDTTVAKFSFLLSVWPSSQEEIEKFCILDIDPDTITWKRVTDCSVLHLLLKNEHRSFSSIFQWNNCWGVSFPSKKTIRKPLR